MAKESPKDNGAVQKLFAAYDAANEAAAYAKSELDAAIEKRSKIVEAIVTTTGKKAFERENGKVLRHMVRGGKVKKIDPVTKAVVLDAKGKPVWVATGVPPTHFFRGEGEVDAYKV